MFKVSNLQLLVHAFESNSVNAKNILAERSGDWKGHFASQANMLPYFICKCNTCIFQNVSGYQIVEFRDKNKKYFAGFKVCVITHY